MDLRNSAAASGVEFIYKAMDSPFGLEILQRLTRRTPANILLNAILWLNLATFLAVVLAHFGLGLVPVLCYALGAYGLIGISGSWQFWRTKNRPDASNVGWQHALLEDAAIWLALIVNAFAAQAADSVVALCLVFALLFLLSGASVKPYIDFVIGKACFLLVCFYVAIFLGDGNSASVQVLFPLAVSFVLLFAVGYWHYLRQVKTYHLMASESHLRRALEERSRELIDEHRLRDRIIRHIGHDLRQPINSVALAMFNLESSAVDPGQAGSLALARRSLESANCLIEDIVQISSYKKHSAVEVVIEPCDMGDLMESVAREYVYLAEQAGCTIRVVPCTVVIDSDPVIISRILRNFFANAVRHARGARILVGVRRRPNTLELQFLDNGPGMPPELVDAIFQEFTRGSDAEKVVGFGLGMNIAQHLATAIDASVAVRSCHGRGTVFSLSLPHAAVSSM